MASESLQVRRRPTKARSGHSERNSNVVRASVLETALELGFGQNSTVADWIFNNPLSEEPEDLRPDQVDQDKSDTKSALSPDVPEPITPILMSGSNSASEESSSLNSPSNNAPSAAGTTTQVHVNKPGVIEYPHVHFDDFSSDQLQLFSHLPPSSHDAQLGETKGNLLGKLPVDAERSHSPDGSLRRNPGHETPSPGPADSGYTSEGQYLSKGKTKNKSKGSKDPRPKLSNIGKSDERDGEYASDGGYISASSNKSQGKSPGKVKSRAMAFFRRRPKKPGRGSDDEDEDSVPPVPSIPILPRPSSPKALERRAAPSPRSGFSPLTLNLANPPASQTRRRVSKSPPPAQARAPLQRFDHSSSPQLPTSPLITSASASNVPTPAAAAATFPLPPSTPGTPLSTASFPITPTMFTQTGAGSGPSPKTITTASSRQHLSIPPPAPPPTLPLPQPPPSPSLLPNGISPSLPPAQITPSRRNAPARPIPSAPMTLGPTQPLTPRRTGSPFRPLLSPRGLPRNGELSYSIEGDQSNGNEITKKQRSGTAGFGSTPAFLQRRIQHGPPPSPRHPPPDAPLPPSPSLPATTNLRTQVGSPSKFHEHFSSVASVPLSQVLSTPASISPSPSITTLSESSSGPSIRSSHISSNSGLSKNPASHDSLNVGEHSRPTTSASTVSEVSYGQPIVPTLGRPAMDPDSRFSLRSDISSSIYTPTTHRDSSSVTTFDDDADLDDAAPNSIADAEDDDASLYPPDDKTAGRRTMYLMEHGELDENEDEIVVAGGDYWVSHEAPPPLPPLPARPGAGYF